MGPTSRKSKQGSHIPFHPLVHECEGRESTRHCKAGSPLVTVKPGAHLLLLGQELINCCLAQEPKQVSRCHGLYYRYYGREPPIVIKLGAFHCH